MDIKLFWFALVMSCDDCKLRVVGAYRTMYDRILCGLCRAFHLNLITMKTYDYIMNEVKKPCRFCGRIDVKKNFDHVNMFEKSDTVGWMIMRGCPEEELIKEVKKCQVLCVDCHRVVTSYERRYKFMEKKAALRRIHGSVMARAMLAVEYDTVMSVFYRWMEKTGGAMVVAGCEIVELDVDV
jgi:hypothetical protein